MITNNYCNYAATTVAPLPLDRLEIQPSPQQILGINYLKGVQTQIGFVVLQDSKIASSVVNSFSERLMAKRNDLIHSKKVQIINDEYMVMEDLLFSSPSLAAEIILGRSANGITELKDSYGKSIKELN